MQNCFSMEQTQEGILVDADLTQEWPWLREAIDEGIAQWGDTDYSYDLIIDLEFYYHGPYFDLGYYVEGDEISLLWISTI